MTAVAILRVLIPGLLCGLAATVAGAAPPESDGVEFFESKIRPLLVARCYECHSHAKKISGGLALDSKPGWTIGGDGGTAIVPQKPDESRLIQAVRWTNEDFRMPPEKKLSDAEIELLVQWVERGAPDPRETPPSAAPAAAADWEETYRERLKWWSLQPVGRPDPPPVQQAAWVRNELDHFILAALESKALAPAAEAERRTLARRLCFALTGLPPKPEEVERFVQDASPQAYENFVEGWLKSPHFGERWARHWMDVVHYSDTHGYEWDIPAKNAWRYRDYLIRAFNNDVPYRQLVLEQVAGDLLAMPRVDPATGVNESLIGPMALRLGERRHGDNAEFEGITQEAVDNVIDTVGKAFLGTTVACCHCHDHKLDALGQTDYFAWAGTMMSSRWVTRTVNSPDANATAIADLRRLKGELRSALGDVWLKAAVELEQEMLAAADPNGAASAWKTLTDAPQSALEDPLHAWRQMRTAAQGGADVAALWQKLAGEYQQQRTARADANQQNLRLLADFTTQTVPAGWWIDGLGAGAGFATDGDFIVADEGDAAVRQIVPAGLFTHLYSPRLQGAVRSPLLTPADTTLSLELTGGGQAASRTIVDHSLFPEASAYLDAPFPSWTHAATRIGPDTKDRRVYYELVTKGLNNNFPARVGLIKGEPAALDDERSWFGVTRIYANGPRQDELTRFALLFEQAPPATLAEAAQRYAAWFQGAVDRWRNHAANADDVWLLNWLLEQKLLPNATGASALLAELVSAYRTVQSGLQPDITVGSIVDLNEGRDERLGVRGSYFDLGPPAPRGNVRFLRPSGELYAGAGSGRLELAESFVAPDNPLTARVYVNRVWHFLFGEGLVRTVDDFGHLGEHPSHPELLDYLARRFMDEGWSTQRLIRLIVTSATWRQSGEASAAALSQDPENRLLHHYPLRRLEAEAIRDAIVTVSGRLDATCFGPSLDPHRHSEDKEKRLFSGPIDGGGRRSLYTKVTMMEPPKFLAEFNQPLPKLTVGRRDVTNVPNQALALLNDPFVTGQAQFWAEQVVQDGATSTAARLEAMLSRALGRPPQPAERDRFVLLVGRLAELRGVSLEATLQSVPVWQDVAHAVFNLKEFIYVR